MAGSARVSWIAKKLAQWEDILGQPLSRKHVFFEIFGPDPPLKE